MRTEDTLEQGGGGAAGIAHNRARSDALSRNYHAKRCSPLALLLLLLLVNAACAEGIRPDAALEISNPGGEIVARIQVEIADTRLSRARGLMHRLLPDDESGMLFVFPDAAPRAFWMRNTPGSLDMLFADTERRITHIARDTQPMSDRTYSSRGAAMYVLETRAGFAARHGIAPGARFDYYPRPLGHFPKE